MEETDWSPERKVVGGAVAVIITGAIVAVTGAELFPGFEGAVGIVVAYFLPNKKE